MSKLSRQNAILELLDEGPVASQEELQRLLRKRGFDAGQATLSRDIRELGSGEDMPVAIRLPGREAAAEIGPALSLATGAGIRDQRSRCAESCWSPRPASAARSQSPPHSMERTGRKRLGTIAGDDTILIVCQDKRSAGRLAGRIQEMLA